MFLISLLAEQDEVMMRSLLSSEQVQVHSNYSWLANTHICFQFHFVRCKKRNINTLFKFAIRSR